jgi:two-component system NarL family sensor kinase
VLQFSLAGLLTLTLLAVLGTLQLRRVGSEEALTNARQLTAVLGRTVIEPNIGRGVVTEDPEAISALDRVVRASVLRPPVVRVKIWASGGRIVYSDEPRLIGSRYVLGSEEREALERGSGPAQADVTDLSRPENRFDRFGHGLLEVYLPVHSSGGTPLLFETYMRSSSVAQNARKFWLPLALVLFGALLLLELVQVPLAMSLSRRVRESQREREELLRHAIEASELERRHIAADLHDVIIQELAAVSYSLAGHLEDPPPDEALTETLRTAADGTRRTIRELRSMLIEIYPPNLRASGLASAIVDLASPLEARGITVAVDVPTDLVVAAEVETLLFRTTREALRNVIAHADARTVTVAVRTDAGNVQLTVEDDGRGVPENSAGPKEGHFGLSLIRDLAADMGGALVLGSRDGAGTRLELTVPAR